MEVAAIHPDLIHGAVSVERTGDGLRPWRIPYSRQELYNIDGTLGNSGSTAGVRLRFRTESRRVVLKAHGGSVFDLVVDNQLISSVSRGSSDSDVVFELPSSVDSGPNVVEIWLPQGAAVWLNHLEIDDGTICQAAPDYRPKWITYGSSITQCGAAHSPARTWPGTAARLRDLNLTCLGYGGQCHLDGMIARMIRDMPADVITVKCGINIQGAASLGPRAFRQAIISSVSIMREKHPSIPIGIISPIISPPREHTPNAVGYSLELMREHVADAVRRLRDSGDENLHYFSGLDIFGENDLHYLPDELHPNGDGYELLGRNMAEKVLAKLLPAST